MGAAGPLWWQRWIATELDLAVYCCMARRINALLVAGGRNHDFDFVRLELLKQMAENPAVHTTVRGDFSDLDALSSADFLVSYTSNVRPTATEEQALRAFVSEGGRWLALHATNAIADLNVDGVATATTGWSSFFELLGTKFIAHPAIRQFDVRAPVSHGRSRRLSLGPHRLIGRWRGYIRALLPS